MKKNSLYLFIFLAIFALIFFAPIKKLAQEPSAQDQTVLQAESTYRSQFDSYRQSYRDYQIAKSEWQKSNTLKAEQEAITAAKKVAVARAEVQKAYTSWLRLKILSYTLVYAQSQSLADRLNQQINWFSDHQSKINASQSVTQFDDIMTEYYSQRSQRERLFGVCQIHHKLAQLTSYQHLARSLYDPVLTKLNDKQDDPEIKQGLSRVALLGEEINSQITNSKNTAGSLESGDFTVANAFKKASESFEIIRVKQLELVDLMNELDQDYAN